MQPVLECTHVNQAYDKKLILNNLSFTLYPGEIGCLLGESGSGKTTALRAIAGFESIMRGEIRLEGNVVSHAYFMMPAHQRQIGMVFQDYALLPHLTVTANIAFGLHYMSATQRQGRVESLLQLIGLSDYARAYPHELSGGQQQRIALARALAPKPRLILLDEPFSSLDTTLREQLAKEVRSLLKTEHCSALLVTHDQNEAFAMADKIGVMHQGSLEQWSTPYDLYRTPATPSVARFIGQGYFIPGTIRETKRVITELGEFATQEQSFPVETPVDVLLRSDDIEHDDTSLILALLEEKTFRGAEFHYVLRLASGQRIQARVPEHHHHVIGEQLGIRLINHQLIVFPQEK